MPLNRRSFAAALSATVSGAGLATGAALPARAADSSGGAKTEASLLDAETRRFQAQVSRDLSVLNAGIADEAVYIHASGLQQDKADYLRDVQAGVSRYADVQASERTAQIIGDLGLTHAVVALVFGDGNKLTAHATGVYLFKAGRWQVLSWQSTPLPKST